MTAPTPGELSEADRERVEAAVSDAFYEARNEGRTMTEAAKDRRIFAVVEAVLTRHLITQREDIAAAISEAAARARLNDPGTIDSPHGHYADGLATAAALARAVPTTEEQTR